MDAFRSSIADRPYPPYRLRRRLLRHISLVKSQEDNQWIQLKRALIKGPVPTPYTIKHSFRLTFRERRTVSSLMLFISRAWDVLILLVFPHDYICAFLIIWKPYQLQFPSYLNNRNILFVIKVKLFPELTVILLPERCESSSRYWHKHKLEGAVYSPNLGFQKSIPRAINFPLPSKKKILNNSNFIEIIALQQNK